VSKKPAYLTIVLGKKKNKSRLVREDKRVVKKTSTLGDGAGNKKIKITSSLAKLKKRGITEVQLSCPLTKKGRGRLGQEPYKGSKRASVGGHGIGDEKKVGDRGLKNELSKS